MARGSGHFIHDQRTAVFIGVALLAAGSYVLYDAYDGRGGEKPIWLRPFTWF